MWWFFRSKRGKGSRPVTFGPLDLGDESGAPDGSDAGAQDVPPGSSASPVSRDSAARPGAPFGSALPGRRRPRLLRRILGAVAFLLLLALADAAFYMIWPDVSALRAKNPDTTAFMEYRKTQWAEAGRKVRLRRRWTPLSAVSGRLVEAVTIAEDDKFWRHDGFDLEGMRLALERDLEGGRPTAGGSTISQQLVKNLYFGPKKSLLRKGNEAIVTWRLERALSKRRILELYLNVIEWGDGIFGIGAAAEVYFHTTPSALTAEQSARLAAVLPNPLRWSPVGDSKAVRWRSRLILGRMQRRDAAREAAKAAP